MGSGRDKRKAAKERKGGPAVGKGQEKTERKTKKNEVGVYGCVGSVGGTSLCGAASVAAQWVGGCRTTRVCRS
jgi:hypothetical protein